MKLNAVKIRRRVCTVPCPYKWEVCAASMHGRRNLFTCCYGRRKTNIFTELTNIDGNAIYAFIDGIDSKWGNELNALQKKKTIPAKKNGRYIELNPVAVCIYQQWYTTFHEPADHKTTFTKQSLVGNICWCYILRTVSLADTHMITCAHVYNAIAYRRYRWLRARLQQLQLLHKMIE